MSVSLPPCWKCSKYGRAKTDFTLFAFSESLDRPYDTSVSVRARPCASVCVPPAHALLAMLLHFPSAVGAKYL